MPWVSATVRRSDATKLIEETPAHGLSGNPAAALIPSPPSAWERRSTINRRAPSSLSSMSTQKFYFLEVARTGRARSDGGVTGADLVEWMIRQAANEKFELKVPSPQGASIQVRLYARSGAAIQASTGC